MYKEAVESCMRAMRINPDHALAHSNLGVAYFNLGMHKEAIESYKQAIRINPDDTNAHASLGDVYVLLNDRDSALEQYKILKSLDSELANKLFELN